MFGPNRQQGREVRALTGQLASPQTSCLSDLGPKFKHLREGPAQPVCGQMSPWDQSAGATGKGYAEQNIADDSAVAMAVWGR